MVADLRAIRLEPHGLAQGLRGFRETAQLAQGEAEVVVNFRKGEPQANGLQELSNC